MASISALFVVALCLVWLADSDDVFTEEEREFFKQLKVEQLSQELQLVFVKKTRSGNSGWCCIQDRPIKAIRHSRIISETIKLTTKVKSGYRKCGFGGWKRCSTYEVRYLNKIKYYTSYYEVPDQKQCEEKNLRCCNNYIQVAGNCLELSVVLKYKDVLLALKKKGMLDLMG